MGKASNRKGDARERELVNLLDAAGFAVMRAPASGSATERELPDILAGNGRDFYAIEAKASGGNPIYVDRREITDLNFFAGNFGAAPLLGVRFDVENGDPEWGDDANPGWYFHYPDSVYVTGGGNYRVRKQDRTDGVSFGTLFGSD